jgi:beta-lactam-binding protein with PASTA domain
MSKRTVLISMLIILVIISFAPLTAFAQQVKVPSIVNMDAAQAKQTLESVGSLRFNVTDSTFTYDQKLDRKVASQNPAAGQIVQRGNVVNVSLYFYTAPVTVPNIVNMSMTQAANTLQSLGLTYKGVGRDTPTTEQSKHAKVAAQNPAAGQIVPKLSTINVTIYQYQPPTVGVSNMVTVPNIVSMDPAQARKTLEGVGLKYQQSIAVLATEQSNHGKVAGQVPPAGQSVQRGSAVTVATYQFQPLVTVPNIVSMRMAQAEKTLEGLGLNSVQGNLIFTTEQSRNGTVCKQDPPAGQAIRKGSTLTIYLCGYQLVAVPAVVSMDQTQAIQALERVGLKYQPVGNSPTTEQGKHGKVASQNPSGGQKAPRGALINITVYQYQPPPVTVRNVVTVPNIVSMDQAQAIRTLENAGFKYQSAGTTATTEQSKHGKVASQNPPAGQNVQKGSAINVYLYQYKK